MVIIDDQERIIAAMEVDRRFKDYEIEMEPDTALQFLEVAPLAGAPSTGAVLSMIREIDKIIPVVDFGPTAPQTGRPHHVYRIGRERGRRVIKVSVFKMYLPLGYDSWGLVKNVQTIARLAGGVPDTEPVPGNVYSVIISWPDDREVQP